MNDYWVICLMPLLNAKVINIVHNHHVAPMREDYYGLQFENEAGQKWELVFLSDAEGNGAGRFELNKL